jgi:GNAT superfamily N-acetyltransferase
MVYSLSQKREATPSYMTALMSLQNSLADAVVLTMKYAKPPIERGDERVAYLFGDVGISRRTRVGRVLFIYMDPDKRGQGLAPALYTEFEKICKDKDVTAVSIVLRTCVRDAESFWLKLGFTRPLPGCDSKDTAFLQKILYYLSKILLLLVAVQRVQEGRLVWQIQQCGEVAGSSAAGADTEEGFKELAAYRELLARAEH